MYKSMQHVTRKTPILRVIATALICMTPLTGHANGDLNEPLNNLAPVGNLPPSMAQPNFEADTEFNPAGDSILARITFPNGEIIFLREQYDNESSIGYLTTGNIDISPLLDNNATALEIFNHFSNGPAPQELIELHYNERQDGPRNFGSNDDLTLSDVNAYNRVPYQNLAKTTEELWDLGGYGEDYGSCPYFVKSPSGQFKVAPTDTLTLGAPELSYDNLWEDFRYDLTHLKRNSFFNRSHRWESQYGSKEFVGPWGYQRDIIIGISSWEMADGFRDSEYEKWRNDQDTVLPWDDYDVEPCTGNCADAHNYYFFAYCEHNEEKSFFNDIKYRLKIKGENGSSTWYSSSVYLKSFGEGARYHSSCNQRRRYSLIVEKKDSDDSPISQERYFVYMRTNTMPPFSL